MRIGEFDLEDGVFVVAEIGNNHEGSVAAAEEMIGRAAEAGVNAVKFQSIDPAQLVAPGETDRLKQLNGFRLSDEEYFRLAKVAGSEGVHFLSTPFFLDAVEFLEPLVPAFKVASGDNNFMPLLRCLAATTKPIFLSSGMSSLADISESVRVIEAAWQENRIEPEPGLVLMHCVSSYPTAAEDANLGFMRELSTLGHPVGYSDHTIGIDAAPIAVALGARVIEKHFTLDKNFSEFRDHQLSCDPADMLTYCERIREAERLLGNGLKRLLECEKATEAAARRSIAASRDLPADHVLDWQDLTWLRPGTGIAPGGEDAIVGKRLSAPVLHGGTISPEQLR
tara:strand:- start:1958 stop:2971 length:1014 start_codon:yes stop_codon:yes gene_type:complete